MSQVGLLAEKFDCGKRPLGLLCQQNMLDMLSSEEEDGMISSDEEDAEDSNKITSQGGSLGNSLEEPDGCLGG